MKKVDADGRIFRTHNIIHEFAKEALVIRVKRKLNSVDVVDALTDLFILRGPPSFIRSDNGAEFVAKKVRAWIGAVGAKTAFIAHGSPLGKWILRELKCTVSGRLAQWRGLHHVARGPDTDRKMAPPLQHCQAAQRSGIPSSSA